MKKSLATLAGVMLITLSGAAFADESADVGKKIYERAFGRGCGSCHDIKTNPQLSELIKEGKLDRSTFENVLKEGKNGMPKAIAVIMEVKAVKDAGYGEDQAVDAIYNYLKNK